MNVELLLKIKAHILEEPMRMSMEDWYVDLSEEDDEPYETKDGYVLKSPPCGTVACISGWAAQLSGSDDYTGQNGKELLGVRGTPWFPEKGISKFSEAQRLFFVVAWPEEFQERLKQYHPQTQGYAQVVADYIDYFIAHEGGA